MRYLALKLAACLVFLFPVSALAGVADCLQNSARLAACAVVSDQNPVGGKLRDLNVVAQISTFEAFTEGVALSTINQYWCPGQGIFQMETMIAVVSKFVRDHPEQWNAMPVNLVIKGLATTFPCAKPAPTKP